MPAHPPKLDEAVTCLVPMNARSNDRLMSKLQQFAMDALGPLLFLYEQLLSDEPELNVDTTRSAVKASVALLANASAHISVERRKSVMK